jgi:hypothetical protein
MVAVAKARPRSHLQALTLSSTLAGFHLEMFRPGVTMAKPKKIIQLLNDAEVSFVLMGAYGLAGWRSKGRATEDVDVLVAKKDHAKAVKVISKAYPKLVIEDGVVVTRFKNPVSGEVQIDLMKPTQRVYQMVFRHTHLVQGSYRIPDLEMALISKFSAMVSPHRMSVRKLQDAADFGDIVVHNKGGINMAKLGKLAEQVYAGGRKEITQLVKDILAGRPIQI